MLRCFWNQYEKKIINNDHQYQLNEQLLHMTMLFGIQSALALDRHKNDNNWIFDFVFVLLMKLQNLYFRFVKKGMGS